MGIIRKRLATSREPCSEAQSAQPTEADPAQPLDERASPAPVAHDAPRKTSKRASQITRPLVIVRIRSKPGQIKQVNETGAPDWSLSAGVAIVLFGFAIAFGTYATLTEREAVQSQLHRFAKHEEPRPAVQHERPSPTIPAVEMAQAPRSPVETPPVPASASSIAAIEARATREASAPSVIVVRSEPP
ncbi:MAG TPA: hypothetical protein VN289_21530, partial [Paraburkholderia sp.]|nr:hypothetical protein [Paraburkholderia sp.]